MTAGPRESESDRARVVLESGLAELQRAVTPAQLDQLVGLAVLVAHWSKTINLTGHRSIDDIAGRLILDACALEGVLPEISSLADIGSGAGFPGFPIAILREGRCRLTSIDSRERRVHFQRAALRELQVEAVETRWGRAEVLDPTPHDAAIAQAVSPPAAAPLLRRWARSGGLLLFLGGAEPPPAPAGVSFDRTVHYRVPAGGPLRSLSIARNH